MIKKLTIALFLTLALSAQAVTWTIHAWRDNLTYAVAYDSTHSQETGQMVFYEGTVPSASGDTIVLTIDAVESVFDESCGCINPGASLFYIRISGPAPRTKNVQYAFSQGYEEILPPGEYWVDFDSNGIARLSTVQPADFGKWSYNGKVNPSYGSSGHPRGNSLRAK